MADIPVGLIGFGYAGQTFHAPLISAVTGLRLAVIASSQGGRVLELYPESAVVSDPMALVKDPCVEIVIVASPNESHAQWVSAALEAGKHVVVDKPIALTLGETRMLTELAARQDRLLAVFQNRRWDSDYLSVKQAIESGAIGRVVHFESHFDRFRPQVRQRWRESALPGAGIWYDLGPHLIDQALQLFGLPITVYANTAPLRQGALIDDWAHALLIYPDHRVLLNASMLVAGGTPSFIVHGDAGSLLKRRMDRQEAQLLAGVLPGADGWGHDPDDLTIWDSAGRERSQAALAGDQRKFYQSLNAAVRGEAQNPTPPHQIMGVMAVLEAGMLSSQTNNAMEPALSVVEKAAWRSSG